MADTPAVPRHKLWFRLLTVLLILVLASLLGHFLLEAAGVAPDSPELSALHGGILWLVSPPLTVSFIAALLVLLPRLAPSLWMPPPVPLPPVALR